MTKSWGPCTWFLFHTLAEKIKEERFMELKPGLIDIIKNICSNLPCPDCKQHATAKIKTLNDKAINNKDSLKKALLLFHNEVNKRLNKPQFIWEELNWEVLFLALLNEPLHNRLIMPMKENSLASLFRNLVP